MSFIETNLLVALTDTQFSDVSLSLLQKISSLVEEAVKQAGRSPAVIYMTGGSAKSPLIQALIRSLFGCQVPIVDGDHFGSVAAGLGVWAARIFQ